MDKIWIILGIVYGLVSIFIFLTSILIGTRIKCEKPTKKNTILRKICALITLIIWSVLPLLRWLLVMGIAYNMNKYGLEN